MREDVHVTAEQILDTRVPGGTITEAGLRLNISVALQYINAWLNGNGAAAIHNLMDDAATAEISRAQLWQWIHHQAGLQDGRIITAELYRRMREEELGKLLSQGESRHRQAAEILDGLVLRENFVPFLTIPAMKYIS